MQVHAGVRDLMHDHATVADRDEKFHSGLSNIQLCALDKTFETDAFLGLSGLSYDGVER